MPEDKDRRDADRIKQKMMLHLNGGDKWSELHYQIVFDGKEAEMMHVRRTDGSPDYKITDDTFLFGEEQLDLLEDGMTDQKMLDWMFDRLLPKVKKDNT